MLYYQRLRPDKHIARQGLYKPQQLQPCCRFHGGADAEKRFLHKRIQRLRRCAYRVEQDLYVTRQRGRFCQFQC